MKNKIRFKKPVLLLAAVLCAVSAFLYCFSQTSAEAESAPDLVASATPGSGEMPGARQGSSGEVPDASPLVAADELFSDRDLEQEPDLSEAAELTVKSGEDLTITEEGVYVLRGTAEDASVIVDAPDDAKVQLVLDGLSITNEDFPCIYVKNADKVFVTTVSDSSLSVTGSFRADGETEPDGVIWSRDDLVLNGSAMLVIRSGGHGVECKDDLKITGGSYEITAEGKGLKANDSIRIAAGELSITAGDDGIHAENDEDDSLGWVYIGGGSLTIDSGDDGIHAQAFVQIDGGEIAIEAVEGIEGTFVQMNAGDISIGAWDDGINAASKSAAYPVCVQINGGSLTILMASGDTDGIDSNGSLIINGGVVDVTGVSGFDYDGVGQLNGGTIILNGQELAQLPNQMMGGPGQGGFPGQSGGPGQGGGRR